ncbi:MAG: hypothetical protein DMF63_18430 [Acidobacteria bacterium]|nr:MAG: hypothetical protein DMF63_18430 [Acidobacteriota bacterium]
MNDELRWHLLKKKQTEELIVHAFGRLRENGIEPILIKGWAAGRNYPADKPRFSIDVDLVVSSADFDDAEKALAGINGVDLHRELRDRDTVDWQHLCSRSELVELDGEHIRLLSAEDHLRVICVHWLLSGATDRERLWDVFYAVQNRPANFSWPLCLDIVSETRRDWVVLTIGLTHKYLGLDISELPFRDRAVELPPWLTKFLEKEWLDESGLWPLEATLKDRRTFLHQLRKRLPPNPVQATVNCEGSFDAYSRVPYQMRDIFQRVRPSIHRIVSTLKHIARARTKESK